MNSRTRLVGGTVLVALIFAFLVAGSSGATSELGACTVKADGSGTHLNIQAAVDTPGCDPISVGAGTFSVSPSVTINRTVTIQGQGPGQTMVDGNASGRVFTIQAGAVVTLTGLTIQNGSAQYGGGIYNEGTLTAENSTLSGNNAIIDGGGIWNSSGGTLDVTHSTFSGNSANRGGGIYNEGNLTVAGSTLSGNVAGAFGAGIHNEGGTLQVTESTFRNNAATTGGGGILNGSLSTLSVTGSTLSGNSAPGHYGGGIGNWGTMTVTHSTLSGNSARSDSGNGIANWSGATVSVLNSIIANSTGGPDCTGPSITSQGYNIDSDGTCNLTATGDRPNTDPKLGPLQDNGGWTWTHALLPLSPALDAGSCPGVTADQRGFPRRVDVPGYPPAHDDCDIGAFEAQWSPTATCQVPGGYATARRIQGAANDPWCDVVEVAAGTFAETVTISRTVTVQGQGLGQTIVDGNAGGRVFTIRAGVTVALTGLTIQNGAANDGGGIWNQGTLTVSHSRLRNNDAVGTLPNGKGGGIRNDGALTVKNSSLNSNSANVDGGGIWNNGTLTVTHSTLSSNTATNCCDGGGIYNYYNGLVGVTNSTLSSNSAKIAGGGIRNWGILSMTHSTLSGNSASSGGGGGIGNGGTLTAGNSIIANSTNGSDCSGAITSQGYNLASDNSCSLTGPSDQQNKDPELGPLQGNGGPTWTHALLPGSPALDKGSCPGTTTDQRDKPRPVDLLTIANAANGDGCDIGAYEFQDVAISGLTASNDGPTISGQVTKLEATVTAGTHVRYTWNFGDGQSGSGRVVLHTYAGPGTYTATVTASNSAGSATKTTTVTVTELIYLPSVLHKVGGCFAGPSEAEPNDSSSQANGPLCPGVQITGSAATGAEDWDVFTFDLPGSATVTVDVLDYLMDAQVFLWYQSTANLVDSDRPDRVDDDYQVQHTNTSGGGRYIVGLFAPGTHPPDTQPYRLTVHSP